MLKKNIVAIVPARANSKRIPGKNIKKFNGKPIIVNTIEKLKKSKIFDRIIVSTDSKKLPKLLQNVEQKFRLKDLKFYQMILHMPLRLYQTVLNF